MLWAQVLILGFTLKGSAPLPKLNTTCLSSSTPLPWKACIHKTENSPNRDILYYFHGRSGDEKGWILTNKSKRKLRILMGQNAPHVVAISFGRKWMLNSQDSKLEVLPSEIIPYIERNYFPEGPPPSRLLWGSSMGGFNALRFALAYPRFAQKLILVSPALPLCAPHLPLKSRVECAFRHPDRVNPLITLEGLNLLHEFFYSIQTWDENDPFQLASAIMTEEFPDLFIACGKRDPFSFYTTSARFAALASSLGVHVTTDWHENGHSDFSPEPIAQFILPSSEFGFD